MTLDSCFKDPNQIIMSSRRSSRSKKQRTLYAPLEGGHGLAQINEESRFGATEDSLVSKWRIELERNGWRRFSPKLHDWGFHPASLQHFRAADLQKYGSEGEHYALGWKSLYTMLTTRGIKQENDQDCPFYSPSITIDAIVYHADSGEKWQGIEHHNALVMTRQRQPQQEEPATPENTVNLDPVTEVTARLNVLTPEQKMTILQSQLNSMEPLEILRLLQAVPVAVTPPY
jgi:hypothetical protein